MKHFKLKASIGVAILAVLYVLVNKMNLNPIYPESAFFYCVLISVYVLLFSFDKLGKLEVAQNAQGMPSVSFHKSPTMAKLPLIVVGVIWVLYFAVNIGSSVLFNVGAYRSQMPEFAEMNFAEDFNTVDMSQLPIVDKAMALKLADKKLGERPSLGSQVVLGEPTLQQVDGELVWAVPTLHSGLFKWLSNMEGTPGYVKVSATNPQDVEYVDGYKIKYQQNAYLWYDLAFYTRFTAAPFKGVTDFSFELDDTGRPFWVISTYKYMRGFSLPEATGAIIMDCSTGASEYHSIADMPSWVDRIQPENFIASQINNKGEYVHGFLNFSDKDKFRASQGRAIIYNNDRCYYFTGLTSVGQDESAIGFVMVDMVTKEPKLYRISGATEMAAQQSAQGKVQQFGYQAAFPLIVNLNGSPTYFMTLKDAEGLIKQYAYVSVEDYQTVGVGESVSEARLSYEKAMRANPGNQDVGNISTDVKTLTGTLERIGGEYTGSLTTYYAVLTEYPQYLFRIQGSLSDELAVSNAGDKVKVEFFEKESGTQEMTLFDNLEFTQ
ncbi:MAG: hypothetical protein RR087_10145, partial [Oscillospiraceae bacterium]